MKKYILIPILMFFVFTGANSASAIEFGEVSMGSSVDIHGYVSQGYLNSSHNNFYAATDEGSFEFSEAAFNVGTDVSDDLHLGIQLLSRKLGEFGKGDVEIDWAFADYRWKDWLGIRAGKIKLPHGLYNTTRDIDFLRTSIFLPQSVYNEAWRDTASSMQGVSVYGDIYLGKPGSISYEFQGGNGEFPVDSGVATTTADQFRLSGLEYNAEEYTSDYCAAGSFVWSSPVQGLKFSLTGWLIDFTLQGDTANLETGQGYGRFDFDTRSVEWTGSVEYTIGDFVFASEYSRNSYDFKSMPYENNPGAGTISKDDLETEGYYASLSYRFTDWFEAGAYYSEYFADKDDKDGDKFKGEGDLGYEDYDAWLKDTCLSLRFDITSNWVLKLEGHKMNGAAILMKGINTDPLTKELDTEEDWYLGAAKMTFNF
ncbi:MAG: hypothetical protein ACQEQS_02540 [Thermodesulfobacteriota bacterium]